jgi:hypothetical protein
MKVWIIEYDHKPVIGVTLFPDTKDGHRSARHFLNYFPTGEDHYYDAVLYERIELNTKSKEKQ